MCKRCVPGFSSGRRGLGTRLVRKIPGPLPALPYWKQRKAGWGLGRRLNCVSYHQIASLQVCWCCGFCVADIMISLHSTPAITGSLRSTCPSCKWKSLLSLHTQPAYSACILSLHAPPVVRNLVKSSLVDETTRPKSRIFWAYYPKSPIRLQDL